MSNTTLMKTVIIILSINILLFIGGVRVVDTNQDFMQQFLNPDKNNSIEDSTFYNNTANLKVSSSQGVGTGIINFIDSLNAVKNFIVFLVNILLTPIGLFGQMPETIGLVIGVPLTVISVLGLLYFIRSGG